LRILSWMKDKSKRVSFLRVLIQLLSFSIIFYLSIIAVSKGLLLTLIVLATLFFGRFFCGWICPFGFYMDLITLFRKLVRTDHWSLPEKLNKSLHKLRYIIALVILTIALAPFLIGTAPLHDILNFASLRQPFTPLTLLLDPLQTLIMPWVPPFGVLLEIGKLGVSYPYVGEIMVYIGRSAALPLSIAFTTLTVAASFKIRRFWCRFCPTGLSIAIVNRFKHFEKVPLLHLDKEEEKCTKCGICKRVCPVQVTEVYEKKGGDIYTSMCTLCLRCVEMCPEKDCLKLNIASKTLFKSRNWLE
jgi:ferredoxin-type protein NapH